MPDQHTKQSKGERRDGLTWLGWLRLRAAAVVVGVPLVLMGAISLGPGWLTLPLVGVAVAAVTMTVNKLGRHFERTTCWTCGTDLASEPAGVHGVVCPDCGALNQHNPRLLALGDRPNTDDLDDADARQA